MQVLRRILTREDCAAAFGELEKLFDDASDAEEEDLVMKLIDIVEDDESLLREDFRAHALSALKDDPLPMKVRASGG